MDFLGKLLPIDGYRVEMYNSLPEDYLPSLMHLYQPLVGTTSIQLYQLLLEEAKQINPQEIYTHHSLMNYLNQALNYIYDARLKLEAIGLLKTFHSEKENKNIYTYRMIAPFSPIAFFDDVMLSELLYHHLGETRFNNLKKRYQLSTFKDVGEDITASFKDVFTTIIPKENQPVSPAQSEEQSGIPLESADFTLIQNMLRQKMIPEEKVLTENNKRLITQLVHMYDLEMFEIEKAILWGLTDENELDIQQVKVACHDLFRNKHNQTKVELTEKREEQKSVKPPNEQLTKHEALILHLDKISPKRLLEDLSGGQNASDHEMKMIRDIMIAQGLPGPVMNVAIYYVMLQSDMKLVKPYLETVASNWSRLKFTTAKEAMDHVMQQINAKPTQKRKYGRTSNQRQKEIIPDWFKDRKKENSTAKSKPALAENEEQAMIDLLKRHASKNN